jgi:hypothetical protein
MLSRNDTIYKQIEDFKDYELTQCVVYEMAIRNPANLKAIREVVEYYNYNKEDISKYQKIEEQINKIDCIGLRYSDTRLSDVNEIIKKVSDFREQSYKDFETTSLGTDKSIIKQSEGKGYNVYINLISYDVSSNVSNGVHILDNFKRPKLNIPSLHSRSATVEIDLNKTLEEIIAYIRHIKKDLEKNKDILKAPIELLGEELHEADHNKMKKSKMYADMFFVYDYTVAEQQQREEENKSKQEEHDEEISRIKNNKCLNGSDKKIQIDELKKEYATDSGSRIDAIFKMVSEDSGIKVGTVKRYYYAIKPYIEKLKYKELITGIKHS